jgi:TusA-related sulfurtransferase
LKAPDKQLRVKASSCPRPVVKSKERIKFIERIGKHPDGWDLVKELSQQMTEVHEVFKWSPDFRHPHPIYFETIAIIGCLINFLLNLTIWLPPITIR